MTYSYIFVGIAPILYAPGMDMRPYVVLSSLYIISGCILDFLGTFFPG